MGKKGDEAMSAADWCLLAALAVLLVLALRFRSRGCGGCSGECSACCGKCSSRDAAGEKQKKKK